MSVARYPSNRIAMPFVGIAIACLLALSGNAIAQSRPKAPAQAVFPNWALGQPNAPVTLIEYASLTCPHCAQFNSDILPTIKRLYIDTGRVRYILRPLPTPPNDLSVGMHVLTLCAGPTRYYPLVDAYFERQREVFDAAMGETGPKGILLAIAEDVGGLSFEAAAACLQDLTRQAQVTASAQAGVTAGVVGTPTLFINGEMFKVSASHNHLELADVKQALDAALRTTSRRRAAPAKTVKKR